MDIKNKIEEILKNYDIGYMLNHKLTAVGELEREKLVNELTDLITPQPEHKSIEGLRKEFEKKCTVTRNGMRILSKKYTNFKVGSKYVWDFFEPHLNSRNLLERLKGLKMEKRIINNIITPPDSINNILWHRDSGYNQAVSEVNSKLDEFIEKELKHE